MNHGVQLALYLLWIACAWWAASESIKSWSAIRVKMITVYLCYVALAPTLCFLPWLFASNDTYTGLYWTVDFLNNFLLAVFGIQAVSHLIPRRFAYLWGYCLLLLLVMTFYKTLVPMPADITHAFTDLSVASDMVVLTVLVCLAFFPGIDWNRWRIIGTTGLVVTCLGQVLPSAQWLKDGHGILLGWIIQVGPLPGLLLLGWGAKAARK